MLMKQIFLLVKLLLRIVINTNTGGRGGRGGEGRGEKERKEEKGEEEERKRAGKRGRGRPDQEQLKFTCV